jgi:drug/metabolite transporter (DMT)-like permease
MPCTPPPLRPHRSCSCVLVGCSHWQWPFGLAPRVVPLLLYVRITSIFFLTSLINNAALDYHISIPVHTVFRSSGLTATLLLGRYIYHMKYPTHQVVACVLVSAGILGVTLADVGKPRGATSTPGCCDDTTASPLAGNVSEALHPAQNVSDGLQGTDAFIAVASAVSSGMHAGRSGERVERLVANRVL